jgi:hypothetical protein
MGTLLKNAVQHGAVLVVLTTLALQQANAYSVVLATNLGPGGTYGNGSYLIQGNPEPGENVATGWATPFTPTESATLQDVVLPLMSIVSVPSLVVAIAADSSGSPGAVLTTFTQNGFISSTTPGLVTFTCNTCVQMTAGTQYWIVTGVATGNTFVEWQIGLGSGIACDDNTASIYGPSWICAPEQPGGFRVDGFIPGLTPQTITFDSIPNQILGVSPFVLAAHASSNLPVTVVSTTPNVCKTAGGFLELVGAGSCSITASQGGSTTYSPAPSVTREFTVSPAIPSGTLAAAAGSPFPVGVEPRSVAVGDFNGDGIPDLAFANYNDGVGGGYVSVQLGTGSGGFAPAVNSPYSFASTFPIAVAVGDFNGDGHLDLCRDRCIGKRVGARRGRLGWFHLGRGQPYLVWGGISPHSSP